MSGRVRIPKTVIYTTASMIGLLLLIVAGAVAYVWYSGEENLEAATVTANDTPAQHTFTPTAPAENAPASASVQALTSPVAPGENVMMSVKTVPTSKCTIKVEYDGRPSTDSGLVGKTADDFGVVSWSWTVGETEPPGKWPVEVVCEYKTRTAVVRGDVVVDRKQN